jgi:hypothetical protein
MMDKIKLQDFLSREGITLQDIHDAWFAFHVLLDRNWGIYEAINFIWYARSTTICKAIFLVGMENLDKIVNEFKEGKEG